MIPDAWYRRDVGDRDQSGAAAQTSAAAQAQGAPLPCITNYVAPPRASAPAPQAQLPSSQHADAHAQPSAPPTGNYPFWPYPWPPFAVGASGGTVPAQAGAPHALHALQPPFVPPTASGSTDAASQIADMKAYGGAVVDYYYAAAAAAAAPAVPVAAARDANSAGAGSWPQPGDGGGYMEALLRHVLACKKDNLVGGATGSVGDQSRRSGVSRDDKGAGAVLDALVEGIERCSVEDLHRVEVAVLRRRMACAWEEWSQAVDAYQASL